MANFNGLTFAIQPVITGAGAVNTSGLAATTVVAGILDPANGIHKIFNPQVVGLPVAGGDAYTKWLPTVTAAPTAVTVSDAYWVPAGGSASNKFGQVTLNLTPAAADTVNASSVMQYKLSSNALVITCTAGTF